MRKKFLRTFVAAVLICSMLVTPAFAEDATVTGNEVYLRSGPGINYRVVDVLPKGAKVTVTDTSNSSWYAVNYGILTGFMSSRYLDMDGESGSVVEASPSSDGEDGYINAMYVRFRSGPSSGSTVLGEYNTGKSVTILGQSNGWTKCSINGKTGYVYSSYVSYGTYSGSPDVSEDEGSGTVIIIGNPGTAKPASTPKPTQKPSSGNGSSVMWSTMHAKTESKISAFIFSAAS